MQANLTNFYYLKGNQETVQNSLYATTYVFAYVCEEHFSSGQIAYGAEIFYELKTKFGGKAIHF